MDWKNSDWQDALLRMTEVHGTMPDVVWPSCSFQSETLDLLGRFLADTNETTAEAYERWRSARGRQAPSSFVVRGTFGSWQTAVDLATSRQ